MMWISKKRYLTILEMVADASAQNEKLQKQINDLRDRMEPRISLWVPTGTNMFPWSGEYVPVAKVLSKLLDRLCLSLEATPSREVDVTLVEKKP